MDRDGVATRDHWAQVDLPAGRQVEPICLTPRDLHPDLLALAVGSLCDRIDADLEAEPDEADHRCRHRRRVVIGEDLDVVGPYGNSAEPSHRPEEVHHEVVDRLVVQLVRSCFIDYFSVIDMNIFS